MVYEIDETKIREGLEELLKVSLNDIFCGQVDYIDNRDIVLLGKNLSKYKKIKAFDLAYSVDVDKYDSELKKLFFKGIRGEEK